MHCGNLFEKFAACVLHKIFFNVSPLYPGIRRVVITALLKVRFSVCIRDKLQYGIRCGRAISAILCLSGLQLRSNT